MRTWVCALGAIFLSSSSLAEPVLHVSYERALRLAHERAPSLELAKRNAWVAEAEGRAAALYPNPSVAFGTSTQTAKLSFGASVPLVLLGQRQAALKAGKIGYAAAKLDTQVALAEARGAAAHAYVALWLAERSAEARADGARVAGRLESAVRGRVELGAAPELEGLRVHAERLRADMDAAAAAQLVEATSAELALWIGVPPGASLRTEGDPIVPAVAPSVDELVAQIPSNPSVRRALAEVSASIARADSERAQVRPVLSLDLGADLYDPTLPATNYRGELRIEVPLFNQRGPLIEREERKAAAARAQVRLSQTQQSSALITAYRTFVALTRQANALSLGVVPAAESAAQATEESYTLGRAPLVSVLDAERARIDARLSLIETRAARANAWIDLELSLGVR